MGLANGFRLDLPCDAGELRRLAVHEQPGAASLAWLGGQPLAAARSGRSNRGTTAPHFCSRRPSGPHRCRASRSGGAAGSRPRNWCRPGRAGGPFRGVCWLPRASLRGPDRARPGRTAVAEGAKGQVLASERGQGAPQPIPAAATANSPAQASVLPSSSGWNWLARNISARPERTKAVRKAMSFEARKRHAASAVNGSSQISSHGNPRMGTG